MNTLCGFQGYESEFMPLPEAVLRKKKKPPVIPLPMEIKPKLCKYRIEVGGFITLFGNLVNWIRHNLKVLRFLVFWPSTENIILSDDVSLPFLISVVVG